MTGFDSRAGLAGLLVLAWLPADLAAAQANPPQPAAVSAVHSDAAVCTAKDILTEDVDAAAAACQRALAATGPATAKMSPEIRRLRLADGDLQLRRHFPALAQADAQAVLAADPDDADGLLLRAGLHDLRGETEGMLADIGAVLKANPTNVRALQMRATHYRDAFDTARARADYGAALKADPSNAEIWAAFANAASWNAKAKDSAAAMALAAPHLDKVTALRLQGLAFENLDQPKKAQQAYDAALALDPRDPLTLSAKASLLKDAGKPKEALAVCDAALAIRPRFGQVLRLKAQILMDAEDWTAAAPVAKAAVDAFSGDIDARVKFAAIQRAQSKAEVALPMLSDVLARDPTNTDALFARAQTYAALKQQQAGIDDYTRVIAREDSAAARYNRGKLYAALGDHAKAADDFAASARLDPKDTDAPIELGLQQSELKQPQAELASYRMALERDPSNVTAMVNLAISYADLDDCKQAVDWYQRALKKQPKRMDLRRDMASCQRRLGRDSDADGQVDEALRIDPSAAWAWVAKAERLDARKRTAQALDAYTNGLKTSPKDVDLLVGRGKLYERLEDAAHARADFDAAVAAAPTSGDALNARGLFLWRQDDNDLALADFDRLIKLGDDGQVGYYNSGLAWRDKGRYDQALRQFNAYLKLNPNDTDALLQKALVYKNLEDYLLAVEYFDAVIRLDPKSASAWSGRAEVKKALGDPTAAADQAQADRLSKSS